LLIDRRVLGEFQMRRDGGSLAGDPVAYYPQIISEELWQRARDGVMGRRIKGQKGMGSYEGKDGFVNLFTGLLHDARNGGSSFNVTVSLPSKGRGVKHRVLRNLSIEGHTTTISFPFDTFEAAFLSMLKEIDPAEITEDAEEPDERLAIATELANVTAQIDRIKDNLLTCGEVTDLADVLRRLVDKRRVLEERQQAAKQREAAPLEEAWNETKTLLKAMENAEDKNQFRTRLRAVLRREITEIWLLIVPRGRSRLCAMQAWFTGGKQHRDYIILHQAAKANATMKRVDAERWRDSLTCLTEAEELDLRRPEDAEALGDVLAEMDLAELQTEERQF
jgi:hypothetical protein